jgi:hypothetical protein
MIFLTLVAMSDILVKFSYGCKNILFELIAMKRPFFIIILPGMQIPGLLCVSGQPLRPRIALTAGVQAYQPFQAMAAFVFCVRLAITLM